MDSLTCAHSIRSKLGSAFGSYSGRVVWSADSHRSRVSDQWAGSEPGKNQEKTDLPGHTHLGVIRPGSPENVGGPGHPMAESTDRITVVRRPAATRFARTPASVVLPEHTSPIHPAARPCGQRVDPLSKPLASKTEHQAAAPVARCGTETHSSTETYP